MREVNFGPIANPDGTPSDTTKEMLAGTGRDPETFVASAGWQIARIKQVGGVSYYKMQIEGSTADALMKRLADMTGLDLADNRQSVITVVVSVSDVAERMDRRDRCIEKHESVLPQDEIAYLMEVMTEDDGTFTDMRARNVSGDAWSV